MMTKFLKNMILPISISLYLLPATLQGDTSNVSMTTTSTTSGSSGTTSGSNPPDIFTKKKKADAPKPAVKPPAPKATAPQIPLSIGPLTAQNYYTMPGIVGLRNGGWEGSDDLFNLTPNIEIIVEMVKGEKKKYFMTDEFIKEHIVKYFKEGGLVPYSQAADGPPLPIFHVLILITPVQEGYAAYVSCRLFEAVKLKRLVLDQDITYQAITWEKQDLIIAPKEGNMAELAESIKELTQSFITRYKYFENLKARTNKN